ncbi:anthranilate phosphoribosyltransferase [Erysipelotrichaceae bacterium]|nr:anthranilate phosphoribosyltransferase [Erysipelotrichaceae bacterium]
MIQEGIKRAIAGEDLSYEMTKTIMREIMSGDASEAEIAGFLVAMRMKKETITEITACSEVMRQTATRLYPKTDVLDIVGTGGDELSTFNISTVSAFVIASCGVPVAKHGNRSVSSKCGSADVLEQLGAYIELSAEESEYVLMETGICFMYAPAYHSSMKYAAPVRKQLGVRTLFNILGPLANPAGANHQILGVYDEKLVEPLAQVLANLGVHRALVVHGREGLDEVSISTTTTVCEVCDGKLNSFLLTPEQLGLKRAPLSEITGGNPQKNAAIALDILAGKKSAMRDIVVMNSACALYLFFPEKTLKACARMAESVLDNGVALAKLHAFIAATKKYEPVGEQR